MFLFRVWFWVPVLVVLFPSTVLHIKLLAAIRKRKKGNHCKSLYYRLFIVQSILELLLLYLYLSGRLLIKDRLLSNEVIMSLNGEIFPRFYYHGTVYFFFHVQIWGVIVQSFTRCVNICQLSSGLSHRFDSTHWFVIFLVNTIVPFAILFRLVLPDGIKFILDADGNAVIYTPPEVVKANAIQSTIFSIVATVFSALCYALVIRNLAMAKWKLSIREYRREKMLTLVGLTLFLSQCTMTAYYVIVTLTAVENVPVVAVARNIYIFPVLLLTFINPWMLAFTNRNLRRVMMGKPAISITTGYYLNSHTNTTTTAH